MSERAAHCAAQWLSAVAVQQKGGDAGWPVQAPSVARNRQAGKRASSSGRAVAGALHMAMGFVSAQRGHTLLEWLTSIVVLGLLFRLGLPSVRDWMDHRAVQVQAEALRSALRLARGVALNRQVQVSLCARRAGPDAGPDLCAPSGRDWSSGWITFIDEGQRGVLEDGDRILHVELPSRHTARVIATVRYVTFQSNGVSLNAASRFTVMPVQAAPGALSDAHDLLVCVNKPGRARILDADAC